MRTIQEVTPARTKADFSYNIKNDLLFRSRIKRATLQTQLNPNKKIGNLSGSIVKPSMSSAVNENFKKDTIYILSSSLLTVTSAVNENFKRGNIRILSSSLLRVTSTANLNFKKTVAIAPIDLSNSKRESVYTATPSMAQELIKHFSTHQIQVVMVIIILISMNQDLPFQLLVILKNFIQ